MQRSLYLVLALFMAGALLTTSCRKDSDNPVDGGSNKPTVTTTIIGVVSDEAGKGLSGVAVSAHGRTVTTNDYGMFVIKDARVPQDRCFVIATNSGYFYNSRAEKPKAGGVTNMRLSMMRNTTAYSVSASAGGTVSITEGGSIQLPANGYVTGSGTPYNGTVKVAARWLNPTASTFYSLFPGDFAATRTDGSQTELYSYGVLNVELMSQTGEKVQLASGKKATLKYPIPSSMLSSAPAEMPLWYFDETIGMWKEEGKAVKQGGFYVGEVSHFTPWNCDIPVRNGTVRGRVLCDNAPVPGIEVQVGQRRVTTDENGEYETPVPADMNFEISVDPARNLGSGTVAPIPAGPVGSQQTITVDVMVTPCPAYLTGTLVDCNGDPAEGVVQAVGSNSYGYTIARNGQFRIRVEPGVALTVNALGYNSGVSEPQGVQAVNSGETFDMGSIELCPQNVITFLDIDVDMGYVAAMALSPDGTVLAVADYSSLKVFNATNGMLIQTLSTTLQGSRHLAFSDDGSKLLCTNDSATTLATGARVWSTTSWQLIREFTNAGSAIFMPNGNSILAINEERNVVQYDVATGAEMAEFDEIDNIYNLVGTASNGTQFVSVGYNNNQNTQVVVWDMTTDALVTSFAYPLDTYPAITDLSADGSVLMTVSWGKILFHNTATGQLVNTVANGQERYAAMALAPNGTRFSGQFSDKGTPLPPAIYNVDNGSMARLLPSPTAAYFSTFAYSNTGSALAGIFNNDNDASIRVWQIP